MAAIDRSVATVLAELAEVRRHLHEAPPHHGGGAEVLRRRIGQLEAELARARDATRPAARGRPAGSAPTA